MGRGSRSYPVPLRLRCSPIPQASLLVVCVRVRVDCPGFTMVEMLANSAALAAVCAFFTPVILSGLRWGFRVLFVRAERGLADTA